MTLILVRHGQSDGNASGVVQGRLDMHLSELGRRQSAAVADRLSETEIDGLVSSPLIRALDTARVIAEAAGMEVELDDALAEYDPGAISGLSQEELTEQYPEVARAGVGAPGGRGIWPSIPGEEGRAVFFERVRDAIERLLERDGTIVAVSHGGVVNAACHYAVGLDYVHAPQRFRVGNCSLTEIRRDRQGRLVLARHNDTCHLETVTQANPG